MLSFILLACAVICLALSMPKHFKDSFARPLSYAHERTLRGIGWGLLLLSLYVMPQQGISYIYWCCHLSMLILVTAYGLANVKGLHGKG